MGVAASPALAARNPRRLMNDRIVASIIHTATVETEESGARSVVPTPQFVKLKASDQGP